MTRYFFNSLKTSLLAATLALLAGGLSVDAQAAEKSSHELVSALPAQIPEILTGGTWKKGDVGGVYRAVVIMSGQPKTKKTALASKAESGGLLEANGMPERKAEVFIQWISYENGQKSPRVVKTVSIKEFNEKQLHHAFLAMNTLKDNEMTLLVTSYDDRRDADIEISVKATSPGIYEPAKSVQ